ncbi:hypothetical protein ACMGDM_17055 [Sphingomonas sp. DT-51]|uniref:hypothetical protein n=1 Tax=Sphingomonas sp. DT-51 TaxID=3396165 RepID=UPI003F1A2110
MRDVPCGSLVVAYGTPEKHEMTGRQVERDADLLRRLFRDRSERRSAARIPAGASPLLPLQDWFDPHDRRSKNDAGGSPVLTFLA